MLEVKLVLTLDTKDERNNWVNLEGMLQYFLAKDYVTLRSLKATPVVRFRVIDN
jgi:hypothetical protein